MIKKKKSIFIAGCAIICVVSILLLYFILIACGVIQTRSNKLVIKAHDVIVTYDGTEHSCTNENYKDIDILDGKPFNGHTIVASIGGTITNVGKIETQLSVKVVDEKGNDVSSKYQIDTQNGSIEVQPVKITIETKDIEKEYDGSELTSDDFTISEGHLVEGQTISVKMTSTITDVGEIKNDIYSIIYDKDIHDVTSNYDIKYKKGNLVIKKRPITITSQSGEKEYDGTPLSNDECFVSEGTLLKNHKLLSKATGNITNIGKIQNTITNYIVDENGQDVTKFYNIKNNYGTLEVKPRKIKITINSNQKQYDGTPLTGINAFVSDGSLINGDELKYKLNGSLTNIGTSEITMDSFSILNKEGINVTENYEVEIENGTLTVSKRNIAFKSLSATFVYNGKENKYEDYVLTAGGTAFNQSAEVEFLTTIKNVGTAINEFNVTIKDKDGNNVSENYDIHYERGLLEVIPSKISISSESLARVYNTKPLKSDVNDSKSYNVSGNVADGETLIVELNNSITEVGSIQNTIVAYIRDSKGNDTSSNYEFKLTHGTLTVLPYIGGIGDITTKPISPADILFFELRSTYDQRIYLRDQSYGDYVDGKWVTPEQFISTNGKSPLELTGKAIGQAPVTYAMDEQNPLPNHIDITVKQEGLTSVNPYNTYNSTLNGSSDIKLPVQNNSTYSYDYFTYDLFQNRQYQLMDEEDIKFEQEYRKFVYDHYLNVPENFPELTKELLEENNIFTTDSKVNIMAQIKYFLKTQYTYNGEFEEVEKEDPIIHFLLKSKQGNCQHFASAAVLLLRTLGVPARYVTGFKVEAKAGETVQVYDKSGHAWAEVYVDGFGWTKLECTNGIPEKTNLNFIKIIANSETREYNGQTLINDGYTIELLEGKLDPSHQFKVSVEGSQLELGKSQNKITKIRIYDEDGNDVSNNYVFQVEHGTLEVTKIKLKIETESAEKIYDGLPLTNEHYTYEGNIPAIHNISLKTTGTITDPGKEKNTYELKITDLEGNNVLKYYEIHDVLGILEVIKIDITIHTESDEKVYDGLPLTNENNSYEGNILKGHTVEITNTGTITEPGDTLNTYDLLITDEFGNDVTSYYNVIEDRGKLTVYKIDVIVYTESDEKVYDGLPLTNLNNSYEGNILANHTIEILNTGTITEPGNVENTCIITITDANGNDVMKYYNVSETLGKLTILKINITVVTDSSSKTYDGTPLTNDGNEVIFENIENKLASHTIEVINTGTITEPGKVDNTYEITIIDENLNDALKYYEITNQLGTLEILKITLKITTLGGEKVYDGTPLTNKNYLVEGDVLSTHIINVITTGTITEPGETNNTYDLTIKDYYGNDVSKYYDISDELGILRVSKIKFTVSTDSDSKVYDGLALTNPNYTIEFTLGKKLDSHIISVNVIGTITEPGFIDNTFNITIMDNEGNDVSKYYEVKEVYGTLTIMKIEIKVITEGKQKKFDGTALTNPNYSIEYLTGHELLFHTITVTNTGTITYPGKADNTYEIEIKDSNGNDASKYYIVTDEIGILEVFKLDITIQTYGKTKVFDGTALTNSNYDIIGEIYSQHIINVKTNGTITYPGTVDNTYDITITDLDGNDMIEFYNITPIYGQLEVLKIKISIITEGMEKVYDGLALTNDVNRVIFENEEDRIANHTIEVLNTGTITEPGEVDNTYDLSITDESGTDYKECYEISETLGKLIVTKIKLFIFTEGKEKVYDGLALTNDANHYECNDKIASHIITITNTGTITDPGEVDNTYDITILDENNVDVKKYYDIFNSLGVLKVLKINITITTESDSKTYDGLPLTNPNNLVTFANAEDELSTHTIKVTNTGTITEPGEVDNTYDVTILDQNGEDALRFYNIESILGTLKIIKIYIAITTDSDSKTYDGLPLTNPNNLVTFVNEEEKIATHTIKVLNTGTITEPGIVDNSCDVEIINEENVDVSKYYDIEYNLGKLEILKINITITTGEGSKPYDGTPLTNSTNSVVFDNEDDRLLTHTIEVINTGTITEPGEIYNGYNITIKDSDGLDALKYYNIKEELGLLVIRKITIVVKTDSKSKPYDGTPLTEAGNSIEYVDGNAVANHTIIVTNTGTITLPGSVDNDYTIQIFDENNVDIKNNYYIIQSKLGTLEVYKIRLDIYTEGDSKVYDGKPLTNSINRIEGNLVEGHTITVTNTGTITDPGTAINTYEIEILDINNKDASISYEIHDHLGTLEVLKIEITVTTESSSKTYDGLPLTNPNNSVVFANENERLDNHYITVTNTGTITEPGTTDNIYNITIVDENGNSVLGCYNIKNNIGTLEILKIQISVTTESASKTYDGLPLTNPNNSVVFANESERLDNHYITITNTGTITDPGMVDNTYDIEILDQDGNEVSKYYNIKSYLGTLEVLKIQIIVTTESDSKVYDGSPLTNANYTITYVNDEDKLDSHNIIVTNTGSIVEPGTCYNTYDIEILDQDGNDAEKFYIITSHLGTLEILKIRFTVITGGDSKTYDGLPLTNADYSIVYNNEEEKLSSHNINVKTTGTITDPGITDNTYEITITDKDGNDASRFYDVISVLGTLEVKKIKITITTGSDVKVYDGKELTKDLYTLEYFNDLEKLSFHTITIDVVGTITDPGITDNIYNITIVDDEGNDASKFYEITNYLGTLEVLKIQISITTESANKVYDGKELINHNYKLDYIRGHELDIHNVLVEVTGTITDPGIVDNTYNITITDLDGNDASEFYEISSFLGTLEVKKIKITVTTGSDIKVYDGKELTKDLYSLEYFNDLEKLSFHIITIEVTGTITDPGVVDNTYNITITDLDGNDASKFYEITSQLGTLEVTKIQIQVTTESANKVYDGEELINHNYKIDYLTGHELSFHVIIVDVTGTITNPGTIDNTYNIFIVDQDGNDASRFYEIGSVLGILEVTKIQIQITTESANKVYDGEELINHNYKLDYLTGHELSFHNIIINVTGTITDPGYADNTYAITITDQDGNDASKFYEIGSVLGLLEVTKIQILVTTESDNKVYDGEELINHNYKLEYITGHELSFHNIIINVTGTITDPGYTDNTYDITITDQDGNDASKFYDIYNNIGTLEVFKIQIEITTESDNKVYDGEELTNAVNSINYLTGHALSFHTIIVTNTGTITDPGYTDNTYNITITDQDGNDASKFYDIYNNLGTLEVFKIHINIETKSANKVYDGKELINHDYVLYYATGHELSFHNIIINVTGTITDPGYTSNTYEITITDQDGNDASKFYEITSYLGVLEVFKIQLEITTESANKVYDGEELTNAVNSINYLTGHALSFHTIIVTNTGTITDPGYTDNTYVITITDQDGNDASKFYDIYDKLGILEVFKILIHVETESDTKVYDGEELTNAVNSVSYLTGHELSFHNIIVTNTGTITDPGYTKNTYEITITDQDGNDASKFYDIYDFIGTLEVTKIQLEITTESDNKVYDGEELTNAVNSIKYLTGHALSFHTIKVTNNGTITDPGTIDNTYDITISDQANNDASKFYDIYDNLGILEVTKIQLEIITESANKVYDGKELTDAVNSINYLTGHKLSFHTIEVTNNGTITDPGYTSNTYDITITDKDKNDASRFYDIYDNLGILEIFKLHIEVSTGAKDKTYDGEPLTDATNNVTYLNGSPITSQNIKVTNTGTITYPGTTDNTCDVVIKDGERIVTDFYDITYNLGILEVKPITFEITTESAVKPYDGKPLTWPHYSYTEDKLMPGHELKVTMTGTITEIGETENTCTAKIFEGTKDVTDYYDIKYNFGTLTVSDVKIKIFTAPATKPYDGTALTNANCHYELNRVIPGHTIELYTIGTITEPGKAKNNYILKITDETGADVKKFYEITEDLGILEVTKRELTIISDSSRREYNGLELTNDNYSYEGTLLENHKLTVTNTGKITEPGKVKNITHAVVTDNNFNVNRYYNIVYRLGDLIVTKINLTVFTDSKEKEYDGTPLTEPGNRYTGNVVDGHNVNINNTGTITEIGSVDNTYEISITDDLGNDLIKKYYNIKNQLGKLKVKPIELVIQTGTKEKEYDGTELTYDYNTYVGNVAEGHQVNIENLGSIIEIGQVANDCIVTITKDGQDVSSYYNIRKELGTLTVKRIDLIVTTGTASKEYDGKPLMLDEKDYSGNVIKGHKVDIIVTGTITEIGSVNNAFEIVITKGNVDVSKYYNVIREEGTLTVTKIKLEISTESKTKEYDGTPLTNEVNSYVGNILKGHKLVVTNTGTITEPGSVDNTCNISLTNNGVSVVNYYDIITYLGTLTVNKIDLTIQTGSSSREYDGTPLTNAYNKVTGNVPENHKVVIKNVGTITNPGTVPNTYELSITDEHDSNVLKYYNIINELGELEVTTINLVVTTGGTIREYNGKPLTNSNKTIEGNYIKSHVINVTPNGTITEIGHVNNTYSITIEDELGNDVSDLYNVISQLGLLKVTAIDLVITTGTASRAYDGTPLTNSQNSKVGNIVSEHKVEITNTGTITEPGTVDNTCDITITKDGQDVSKYYNVIKQLGTLTVNKIELTIITDSKTKEYDGTPLVNATNSHEGNVVSDHKLVITNTGTITEPGTVNNTCDVTITKGNEDVSRYYNISYRLGKLSVLRIELTIQTESATKEYDGTPLTNNINYYNENKVLKEHIITLQNTGTITEPGTVDNTYSISITENGIDVTEKYYNIKSELGTLEIIKIKVTITTTGKTKEYDGTALTCNEKKVEGNLLPGHVVNVNVTGKQTEIGFSNNTCEYEIVDVQGNDVKSIYDVDLVLHKLIVTKIKLVIKTEGKEKVYDGTPLSNPDNSYTGNLLANHTIKITNTATLIEPGQIPNGCDVTIQDKGLNDVSDYYDLTYDVGTLIVKKIALTIETGAKEKEYDGTELVNHNYNVKGDVLSNHTLNVQVTGTQTEIGYSDNTCNVTILDGELKDVSKYYEIIVNTGILTVTKIKVVVKTNNAEKEYDGMPLTSQTPVVEGNLLEGHSAKVNVTGTITEIGEAKNTCEVQIVDESGADVSDQYTIEKSLGTLVVTKIKVEVTTGSGKKEYDGTELVNKTYSVSTNGHLYDYFIEITGTQTEVGKSDNTFEITIYDENHEKCNELYQIVPHLGKLEVYKIEQDLLTINSNASGNIYLRDKSYGSYNGQEFVDDAPIFNSAIAINPLDFIGKLLEDSGAPTNTIKITPANTGLPYLTPYFRSNIEKTSGTYNDVHIDGDMSQAYTLNYYDFDLAKNLSGTQIGVYNEAEAIYRKFVYDSYLGLPDYTRGALLNLANKKGLSIDSQTLIEDVQNFVSSTITYTKDYKQIPVSADAAYYILTVSKTGVCTHFALAATALYRALGIPARYVTGFYANATAGVTKTLKEGHAWVEVYIDGKGWLPVEVTKSTLPPTPHKEEIYVQPEDVIMKYEPGIEKIESTKIIMNSKLESLKKQGYTWTYNIEGSQQGLGSSTCNFTDFVIRDPEGKDVSQDFKIIYKPGKLQLYYEKLTIDTKNVEKEYDGSTYTPLAEDAICNDKLYSKDHKLEITFKTMNVEVASYVIRPIVKITDSEGNDITYKYQIAYKGGNLKINPRSITITAGSAEKKFDSMPLTCETYEISKDSLLEGHVIDVIIVGSQTKVGLSPNKVTRVTIYEDSTRQKDVTKNYSITKINGRLLVTP